MMAAGMLGAIIGFERQWRQREVGLHTSALVAMGAALFSLLGAVVTSTFVAPVPILANIVTGVGFLAGGVILRQGTNVTGLSTAATIWATAGVGAIAGCGLYPEAAMAATAVVAFNFFLLPVASAIDGRAAIFQERRGAKTYSIRVRCTAEHETQVRSYILERVEQSKLNLLSMSTETHADFEIVVAEVRLMRRDDEIVNSAATSLSDRPGVAEVTWRILG